VSVVMALMLRERKCKNPCDADNCSHLGCRSYSVELTIEFWAAWRNGLTLILMAMSPPENGPVMT